MLSLAEQAEQSFPDSTVVRSYLDFISQQAEMTDQTIEDIEYAFFNHLPDLISQKQAALTTAKRRAAVATFLANSKLTRKENSAIYTKIQGAEFKDDETEDIEKHQQDLEFISAEIARLESEIEGLNSLL